MPSVMAIVSKAVYERDANNAAPGDVWPTDQYLTKQKRLEALNEGGDLYLVTVRPPDEALWLMAVLRNPQHNGHFWEAQPNTQPVTDISELRSVLKFTTGKGLPSKKGSLGMSLQTPRVLTDEDIAALTPAPTPAPAATAAPSRLDGVLALLREGAVVRAHSRLLDLWAENKEPALAALIVTLDDQITRSLAPIEARPKSPELGNLWLDVAGARRAADIARLIAVFPNASANQLKEWFGQLLHFKPHPSVALAALEFASLYSSTGAGTMRTAAFKLAEQIGDGSVLEHLPRLANREPLIVKKVERLQKKLSPPGTLSEADLAAVAIASELIGAIGEAPVPDEATLFANTADESDELEESLLAAVFADPDDDAARLVYADWLSERGRPRGEFIMLQYKHQSEGLNSKETKREKALIKAHGGQWIHPLDAVVKKPRFERGFLTGCEDVKLTTKKQRSELIGHRMWSTVREIDHCDEQRLLLHSGMRSLRRIACKANTLAAASLKKKPLAFEDVATVWVDVERLQDLISESRRYYNLSVGETSRQKSNGLEHWEKICKVGALTNLKTLRLSPGHGAFAQVGKDAAAFAWLTTSPLGQQLERLIINNDSQAVQLVGWLDVFETHPKLAVVELAASPDDYYNSPNWSGPHFACDVRWVLRRTADGLDLTLQIEWPFHHDNLRPIQPLFETALEGLPTPAFPSVTLEYTGKRRGIDMSRFSEVEALIADKFDEVKR